MSIVVRTKLTELLQAIPRIWGGAGISRGPTNTALPVISGTVEVGQTLTVSDGTWTGTGTITYAYQWLRNGAPIGGATNSTYTLVEADAGYAVTARVTATDDEGARSAIAVPVSVPGGVFEVGVFEVGVFA